MKKSYAAYFFFGIQSVYWLPSLYFLMHGMVIEHQQARTLRQACRRLHLLLILAGIAERPIFT